jgi:hypothetical protein
VESVGHGRNLHQVSVDLLEKVYNLGMMKGYVQRWQIQRESHLLDVWFNARPENAATWKTKEEADIDCKLLDSRNVVIRSSSGGNYICRGFKPEERNSNEFVVFCEAPFISE